MKKFFGVIFLPAFLLLIVSGCTQVRTYAVEKDRVDQNLVSGNQGFLTGTPAVSAADESRKLTRRTYVAEIEVGRYGQKGKTSTKRTRRMAVESVKEPVSEPIMEEATEEIEGQDATRKDSYYTVEPNDTLGKISLKVYGTAKKWKKIFEANADQLKTPDKIYAGQVLKIPQETDVTK